MKFDDAYDYVKYYFQRNFFESYLIFEGRMQYIENDYLNFFRDNIRSQYNIVDITSGNLDNEINKYLENFVDEYFTKRQREDISVLYNYVKDLLVKRGFNLNFSNDIFDHIVKRVSARVWFQFDRSRLEKEDFDHVINLVYNNIRNEYDKMICVKVDNILDMRSTEYFELKKIGLDKEELKKYVVELVFKSESRVFLIKIKSLIINLDKELSEIGIKFSKYINQYFSKYSNKYNISSDKEEDYVRSSNFYNQDEDVEDKKNVQKNNGEIKFNLDNMKNNSVQNVFNPKKIRLNKKQVKITKMVVTLALLGTLLGVGIGVGLNNSVELTEDEYALMRVDMLSNFDYEKKWSRNSKYYNEMADEIISLYSKLDQLPYNTYKTLGLYRAYDGCCKVNGSDAALNEMETFFCELKKKMVNEDINVGLRNVIKADDEEDYFYLDFVYDMLNEFGFKEINAEKYQNALLQYKYANYGNYFGVVGVKLSESEKAIIDEVMNKYVEYHEKSKLDIGYLMVNGEYTFFATYHGKGM